MKNPKKFNQKSEIKNSEIIENSILPIESKEIEIQEEKKEIQISKEFQSYLESKFLRGKRNEIQSKSIEGMRKDLKSKEFSFHEIKFLFDSISKEMIHSEENRKERFHHLSELFIQNSSFKKLDENQKSFFESFIIPNSEIDSMIKNHFSFSDSQLKDFYSGKIEIFDLKGNQKGKFSKFLSENNGLFIQISIFEKIGEKMIQSKKWRRIQFFSKNPIFPILENSEISE